MNDQTHIRSYPFLVTQVLQQIAEDYREEFPNASETMLISFYVDDYLSGADSEEEEAQSASELCGLLQYRVKLPRKVPTPELGGAAQHWFLQNERSLAK